MVTLNDKGEVEAAGGVVWRVAPGGGEVEVLLVHRPRYDDWSFPKGKVDPGETVAATAEREVEEETGLLCRRGEEVGVTRYHDSQGRPKVVTYWLMDPVAVGHEFAPNREIDALRWCPPLAAHGLLSYEYDRDLLDRAAAMLPDPLPPSPRSAP
jgi:8-oxo-dGTP diphosphatase